MISTPAYKRMSDEELITKINAYLEKYPTTSRSKLITNIGSSYDRIVGLEKEGKITLPTKRTSTNAWSQNFQFMGKELGKQYGRRDR
jgi:hypothetical protein